MTFNIDWAYNLLKLKAFIEYIPYHLLHCLRTANYKK